MMTRLTGRTVIVTGGAQGIGASYARAVAAEGANVAVCDVLPPDKVVAGIEAAGGQAMGSVCDITDAAAVAALVGAVTGRFGSVDGLVNNAAIFASLRYGSFMDITSEAFDKVMQVNVRGSFECIRAVVPVMRARGYGKIINIASGTVFKGTPGLMHYTASKGAVIAMTRVAARELGKDGIRVNCVAPGFTLSEGIADADQTAEINAMVTATRRLQRDMMPQDLNGMIGFLLSAESDFMTGQTVIVDGGSAMN